MVILDLANANRAKTRHESVMGRGAHDPQPATQPICSQLHALGRCGALRECLVVRFPSCRRCLRDSGDIITVGGSLDRLLLDRARRSTSPPTALLLSPRTSPPPLP